MILDIVMQLCILLTDLWHQPIGKNLANLFIQNHDVTVRYFLTLSISMYYSPTKYQLPIYFVVLNTILVVN